MRIGFAGYTLLLVPLLLNAAKPDQNKGADPDARTVEELPDCLSRPQGMAPAMRAPM